MTAKKDPKDCKKGGRPTRYSAALDEQAYKLCLLGATDQTLADSFGVTEKTINNWKKAQPTFLQSITRGKELADADIAESLYHRAKGYSHPEEKIFQHDGEIIRAETIRQYPPDTPAASLWLRNRQPQLWRDKQEIEVIQPKASRTPEEVIADLETVNEQIARLEARL